MRLLASALLRGFAIWLGSAGVARAAEPDAPSAPPPSSEAAFAVTGEVGGGQTKPSPDTPMTSFFYQRVGGRWTPSDRFDLAATLRVTEDFARPPDTGSVYATSRDTVFFGSLAGTYDFAAHWNASLGANGSAPSTRDYAVPSPLVGATADPDALVRATTWSLGGVAELEYDSFDEKRAHGLDLAVDGGAAVNELVTEQTPVQPSTAVTALGTKRASLTQVRLGGTVTATALDDTDVGVDAAYFLYDDPNPADVGTFTTAQAAGATWGAGLPMLPPRWTVRPEVAQRLGNLSLRAYYQYADIALDGAHGHTVGARAQLSLQNVKVFVTGSFRSDVFASDETAETWTAGAGFVWRL